MSVVKIQGNASGTGQFTIAAPNSNNTRTMTLADTNGTIYIAPGDGMQALASGVPVARTLTAGSGITITNGDGVAGNPTISASSSGFPSGTAMLFAQTAAPTGWTKSTTHNDKALRVVSGTASSGGSSSFSTVFTNQTPTITTSGLSAAATTLSTAQIPGHTHSGGMSAVGGLGVTISPCYGGTYYNSGNTGSTGGGGSHSHSISGSATSSAITLAVQYVDVIIATKD